MSKISHRKCLRGKWIFFRRSLGGPRTETTFQKWSASLKRLRTAALHSNCLGQGSNLHSLHHMSTAPTSRPHALTHTHTQCIYANLHTNVGLHMYLHTCIHAHKHTYMHTLHCSSSGMA